MTATPLNDDRSFMPDADPDRHQFANPKAFVAEAAPYREPAHFTVEGDMVAAHVYRPDGDEPFPAVVLIGPETYVKEQAPAAYGWRLARRGYLALTFDPRGRGESGGYPRDLESPLGKVADIGGAVDFLASHPAVDARRIFAIGICQGSSEMVRAVADDGRIRALATLAGHYRDAEGDAEWFGGDEKLRARRATAENARDRYETDGTVDYVKGVDKTDPAAGMPGELVWSWYHRWAEAGLWPDRFAVMSDAELLAFESMSASERLTVPYLMFHSEQCMLPDAAHRHFEKVPAGAKQAHWWGDLAHFQFYDDPRVIEPAVARIDEWFRAHGNGSPQA